MSLLRSSAGFAISTAVRILVGLLIVKSMAWHLGPQAFGMLGQMMTVVAIASMFAGGGTALGLTKQLSEPVSEAAKLQRLGSAMVIYVAVSSIVTIVLVFGSRAFARSLLDDAGSMVVIWALAVGYWLVGIYSIVQSIFSSRQDVRSLVALNIVGALAGAAVFLTLLYGFGFIGAAFGLVAMPAINGLSALLFARLRLPVPWLRLQWNPNWESARELLAYGGVMLVSAAAVPMAQLAMRNMLGERLGWDQVGYWQGVLKISDVYFQFVGVVLTSFILPKFAAARSIKQIDGILRSIFSTLLPLAVVMLISVYLLRNIIIELLFSRSFLPMTDLFLPQVLGDFIRICGSIIAYIFLARGWRRIAIASELLQAMVLLVGTWLLVGRVGIMAPIYAYCVSATLTLMLMLWTYSRLRLKMAVIGEDVQASSIG
ncbi:O-antigen translocase [Pandoraea sputorum]|uniref:Lipid III flippase n=1 Tax=Pandoraea sputorum TaxID=93222 RepID=A0A5E5B5Y8_9BURK|nr:O-antigen translocase [Pandoraea sputorum]VVE81581.1 Lipid III flippase [Pandoraea sputorum]